MKAFFYTMSLSDFFIATAHAADTTAKQPSALNSIAPLILVFAIFYFFVIRPQNAKYKQQQMMINETKVGDEVIILAGLFGAISKIDTDTILVKISDSSEVKVYKSSIVKNITAEERAKKETQTLIESKTSKKKVK